LFAGERAIYIQYTIHIIHLLAEAKCQKVPQYNRSIQGNFIEKIGENIIGKIYIEEFYNVCIYD